MNVPVRKDVSMTGEITLTGKVLPVGGIREKILAAKRAGIKMVLLPSKNLGNIGDIPEELLKNIEIVPAERIDDVIINSLVNKSGRKQPR
jgi:ATP-dependent Lon protease